jgi:hypothetical protein
MPSLSIEFVARVEGVVFMAGWCCSCPTHYNGFAIDPRIKFIGESAWRVSRAKAFLRGPKV